VRQTLADIGYTEAATGIDPRRCRVQVEFNHQAREIGQGVDRDDGELGAGDQGLMFGYACDETPELMPLPISLAHALMRRQAALRRSGDFPWLRPDAKSQVTVRYVDRVPVGVEKVVLSTQHAEDIDTPTLREEVRRHIVEAVIPESLRAGPFEVLINPTGRFTVGGPKADTGLTGRKIIVDTYGGACPHGGGAFSGKDPSKVDRSAAYMARYIAKNLVAAGYARRCLVQIAYAIGTAEPVSFLIDTQGTGTLPDEQLEAMARDAFPLTPQGIIDALDLRRPIYAPTAAYGHFGREDLNLFWERTEGVGQSVSHPVAYPRCGGAQISCASSTPAAVEHPGDRKSFNRGER
jgi:S-adenosylmethionine synthetase